MELINFDGVLWKYESAGNFIWYNPYCPKHKLALVAYIPGISLEDSQTVVCRINNKTFSLSRRVREDSRLIVDIKESDLLKNAQIMDLDNIYTPKLRVEPKPKDKDLSIQVEIDETPRGKKLVIYAADRKDASKKSQIFIDPQKESTTFDGKDLHPNAIFAKVEITYKSGKKTTLEDKEKA